MTMGLAPLGGRVGCSVLPQFLRFQPHMTLYHMGSHVRCPPHPFGKDALTNPLNVEFF